jgi:hypothetical protein
MTLNSLALLSYAITGTERSGSCGPASDLTYFATSV